jgi:hypothetical protein
MIIVFQAATLATFAKEQTYSIPFPGFATITHRELPPDGSKLVAELQLFKILIKN